MTKFEGIIFDLDGTAIPNAPDGMPSPEVVRAAQAASSSIKLCAASGRSITLAKPVLSILKLKHPCVLAAGTQIVDPVTEKILWELAIERTDAAQILTICRPYPYKIYMGNETIPQGKPAAERTLSDHVNVMYIMACTPADASVILREIEKLPNITAAGVTSWTHQSIDIHITHREATKEHAIAKLLEILGVPKAKTVGVGDANNDVHLFKAVGKKVAMGNATELLKSQADEVCASVDDDGLAAVIRKYS